MDHEAVLARTETHVREVLAADSTGHDWWHIDRVRRLACRLAAEEAANRFVVELAALLHDVADWKLADGGEEAGPEAAARWLADCGLAEEMIEHVCSIIRGLSFKGSGVPTPMSTIEGKVVQDADRLDALGAIGIARAFAYGGHKGRAIFDPAVAPQPHASFAAYQRSASPTINHFHEKLLLLRDRMNTATARRLAEQRHAYMEGFLARFHAEWEGEL